MNKSGNSFGGHPEVYQKKNENKYGNFIIWIFVLGPAPFLKTQENIQTIPSPPPYWVTIYSIYHNDGDKYI